jgi:hypothetical protein
VSASGRNHREPSYGSLPAGLVVTGVSLSFSRLCFFGRTFIRKLGSGQTANKMVSRLAAQHRPGGLHGWPGLSKAELARFHNLADASTPQAHPAPPLDRWWRGG